MLGIALAAIQFSSWVMNYNQHQGSIHDVRYLPYQQVSTWLIDNAKREQSIATLEIGYIGYFTQMQIVDLYGLISPGLFPWLDEGTEVTLAHAVALYSPDFVLLPDKHTAANRLIRENPDYRYVRDFEGNYHLYERIRP